MRRATHGVRIAKIDLAFLSTLSLRRATATVGLNLVGQIFLSTLSLRRATTRQPPTTAPRRPFLSTLSLRRATVFVRPSTHRTVDFYPRSPCGERLSALCHGTAAQRFLSTLSLRRATVCYRDYPAIMEFLSTLSLRRATSSHTFSRIARLFLSTLSLRRATMCHSGYPPDGFYFYPRSPCGERQLTLVQGFSCWIFLSTLSLRRATRHEYDGAQQRQNFYPRSPCGERRCMILMLKCCAYFYPRSPCGERRYLINTYHRIFGISIHALLAESDKAVVNNIVFVPGFLSTLSLRRATFACWYIKEMTAIFLSTLSLRRATHNRLPSIPNACISIHALLAESDSAAAGKRAGRYYFYPRSPCGERLHCLGGGLLALQFLSTLSLRRATRLHFAVVKRKKFLSTLSLRRATDVACGYWH